MDQEKERRRQQDKLMSGMRGVVVAAAVAGSTMDETREERKGRVKKERS